MDVVISILNCLNAGDIAGGCSTSGLKYKAQGRVGDSPIIGSGLYVDNEVGAASATGVGEDIMRLVHQFHPFHSFIGHSVLLTVACILLKDIVYLFWLLSWWGAECIHRKLARWLSVVCSGTHETRLFSLFSALISRSHQSPRSPYQRLKNIYIFTYIYILHITFYIYTEGLIWH